MLSEQELRKRIMRRVYVMYAFRQITQPAVRAGVFITSIVVSLGSVSIPSVIVNLLSVSGLSGLFRFIVSAVTQTELLVQLMMPVALLIALWSAVEALRRSESRVTA